MSEQNILATVDGVNITDADVDAYIKNMPQEQHAMQQVDNFDLRRISCELFAK